MNRSWRCKEDGWAMETSFKKLVVIVVALFAVPMIDHDSTARMHTEIDDDGHLFFYK